MICKSCGADIDDKELLCPYCGTENENVAKEEQEDYIESFERKKKDLVNIPKQRVNKTTKYVLLGVTGLFGLFLVGMLVSWIVAGIMPDHSLDKQKKQLAKLETYYDNGEYIEMYEYLEKIDEYGGAYEKYYRIGNACDNMDWRLEALKNEQEFIKKLDLKTEDVATTLSYTIEELVKVRSWEMAEYSYDEEQGATYIRKQYMNALKQYMLLTDEEIEAAVEQYTDSEDLTELAKLAIQRNKE